MSVGDGWVLTREEVRELDRRAIEEVGVPSFALMENAGRACVEVAEAMLAGHDGFVAVLVGPGNNGGDGLVIARTLMNRGRSCRVFFIGPHEKLDRGSPDFDKNLALLRAHGGAVEVLVAPAEVEALGRGLGEAALVVDALFGTGLSRDLVAPYDAAIAAVNACEAPVLAVDLPSGLDANTGEILGAAVQAARTVTFVAEKPGLRRGEGPALAGEVTVAEIGIPRFLIGPAR